ncbi:MAG: Arylsulfatase [candidate division BRC1 bacterium ADurb.BinA364]|nr:MAG: Arylsulfatase [candidate division BRC1 bacterium ADurb.BinA364]
MEENRDRNFMATLSMSPPHAPWICSTKYYDMYDPAEIPLPASFDHKPEDYRGSGAARWGDLLDEECKREYLRCYYGQVSMIDDVFGRVLEALDRLGLKDDTLVIYTSDHGDLQTAHSLLGKSAYGFFDEIVRVPLIMRYPKAFPAGEVREHFAGSVDLAPTILSLAGQPVPEGLHGRDLRPAIEGRQADDFDAGFCERGAGTTERFGRMIRTAKAKYCVYGDGRVELFDYETDPHEMRNVANEADYRELRATLHERLRQQAAATGDPALERIPPL